MTPAEHREQVERVRASEFASRHPDTYGNRQEREARDRLYPRRLTDVSVPVPVACEHPDQPRPAA